MVLVDAHFHSWQLARGDYGWLTPALGAIYRDVDVSDWLHESAVHRVDAGVLVQAAATEAETWHLLRLAEQHPQVLGVVGWVDFLAPEAPARIGQLARHKRLKGLRPMLQDIADPDWILQPSLQPALALMAELDLTFDALVKPVHLPRLLELSRRHPGLRMVLDHAAKPDIAAGQWQPWADQLLEIAQTTGSLCKLSGLLTEAGPGAQPQAVQAWAKHLISCFGPQRVMWGSDWPVLERAGSYATWWQACQTFTADLDAQGRAAVFGGNAWRFYRLGPMAPTSPLESP